MRADPFEEAPPVAGRILDARLHLLDRQILDVEGEPVAAVDDIELTGAGLGSEADPSAPPDVVALVTGPMLTTRLFGGHTPRSRLHRIPWKYVAEVGVAITLSIAGERLAVSWPERWLRSHVIGRIPGGHHDPE